MHTTMGKKSGMRLRGMMHDDLADVLTIETEVFLHPWSEQDFLDHLEDYESVALVAECETGIAGYFVIGLHGPDIDICSCVVAPSHRRQGLATLMVGRLTSELAEQTWERISVSGGGHSS